MILDRLCMFRYLSYNDFCSFIPHIFTDTSLEIDAILAANRVVERVNPISVTSDGVNTEYLVDIFDFGVDLSFKIFVTLAADVDSLTPVTVTQLDTVEFRIYNTGGTN